MESNTHLFKVYERVPQLEKVAAEARLRFLEWKIAFALDGLTSGADIALAFGLTEEHTNAIFARLVEKGIIAEIEISLDEYWERTETRESEPATHRHSRFGSNGCSAIRGSGEVTQIVEPTHSPVAGVSALNTRTFVTGTNGSASTAALVSSGTVSFSLKKRFRLKAALDFIQGHAGGGTLGQLAVYRTFMLIPAELLKETGLHRLDFNDDSVEISNPKLRKAIVDAIGKTLRVELPVGYFLE